jgi:hypothetical protein
MTEPQYPPPRSVASVMKKEQLQRQFAILGDILNAGTLLVDVRRTDFEGGTIRGSLNLPAQSFPLVMPTLYRLCAGDGLAVISRVVFYCGKSSTMPMCPGEKVVISYPYIVVANVDCRPRLIFYTGSSNGRGPRCAGWFKDC